MLAQYLPPGRRFFQLVGSLIGLSFFISGCVATHRVGTAPTSRILPRTSVSTEEAILSLQQRNDYITSLRTITRLILATPEGQRSFSASLLVQKPHFIRLEVLNMFMQPLQFFVLNEHNLLWYIPQDKKALYGASTSLNIYRLLGVRLSVSELVNVLLGSAPLPPGDIKPTLFHLDATHLDAEPSYLLQFCLMPDQCSHNIWLDPYRLYGIRLMYTDGSAMGWLAKWGNFEQLQGYYLPTQIKLERLDQSSWLALEYDQPTINLPLSSDKFQFALPPGVETVLLDS